MINLEEEARKRRERLKSAFSSAQEHEPSKTEETVEPRKSQGPQETEEESKAKVIANNEQDSSFEVPEGEILLDASGAEILSFDSK